VYSQDGLCAELGISRTPVREALLELQQEGYLTIFRGRGIEITALSRKEAEDIVELRRIIELGGCELAAQRATEQDLIHMADKLREMSDSSEAHESSLLYKLDRQFHLAIFQAAGNQRLLNSVEQLRDHFLRIETLDAFNTTEKCLNVVAEHRRVYDAITVHDSAAARLAMEHHLDCTYERTVKRALETHTEPKGKGA
ncbi:MAG: GntR family transcriptional regulator, partial [Oscillospiraceae bacterium]